MTRAEQLSRTALEARAARIGSIQALDSWMAEAWAGVDKRAKAGRRRHELTLPQELAAHHEIIADTFAADGLDVYWASPTELRLSWP